MTPRIAHIGIAVRNLAEAARLYGALGLETAEIEEVSAQGVRVAMIPLGESRIELLEPLGDDSPLQRFLERRGEGIHHYCIEVTDIAAAMERLRDEGARLTSDTPQPGAGGTLVAFVHPASANGVLIEISQPLATTRGESHDR